MSTKYFATLCDTNERGSSVLENFLDNCKKFESLDVMGGSRLFNNYQKSNIKLPHEISIIKSYFDKNYNMYYASAFNENPSDIQKSKAYNQNFAEIGNVVVLANGYINNKEIISRQYEFSIGYSLQEFLLEYYRALRKKQLNNFTIPNMIRDIDSELLSFIIFDKNYNELYVYNRGDILYMYNIPGITVTISTEILPFNNIYPHFNYHKLDSNCAMKIDSKTMLVQYLPTHCNTFSYGRDLMIDHNKGIIFTEACDLEYYTALSLLSTKEVITLGDLQTLYFGFDTDIDKMIFDRIIKLRKLLKVQGKLPVHIPYNFVNIYKSESEVIEDINKRIREKNNEDELLPETIKNKKNKKNNNQPVSIQLKDKSTFLSKKYNFIAQSLINWALDNGVGNIFISNINKRNNRLISILKSLINAQLHTPLYVYTILDEYNLMDCIRYIVNCKDVRDLDSILYQCDRSSMSIEINDRSQGELKYNPSSEYNYETICAFMKCAIDNPFEHRYIGNSKNNNAFINKGYVPDRVFDNQMCINFLDNIIHNVKDDIINQKKILSY